MIIKGSITYDSFGRRRKTTNTRTQKAKPQSFRGHFPQYNKDTHREQYPSMAMESYSPVIEDTYKKEVSKQYTVSIAYNKGAYQVIPKSDIKHIGK
tara:strand:- start:12159 stop:12446 length:288 start_codon:yes stop_codon:yes gene_type:complete